MMVEWEWNGVVAVSPGSLGLDRKIQSYAWHATNANNLKSRASQTGKVARATRAGYWFERDCQREATMLEGSPGKMDTGWRDEALASSFDMTESKCDGGKMYESP